MIKPAVVYLVVNNEQHHLKSGKRFRLIESARWAQEAMNNGELVFVANVDWVEVEPARTT